MAEPFPRNVSRAAGAKNAELSRDDFRDFGLTRVCLSRMLPEEKKDAIKEAE